MYPSNSKKSFTFILRILLLYFFFLFSNEAMHKKQKAFNFNILCHFNFLSLFFLVLVIGTFAEERGIIVPVDKACLNIFFIFSFISLFLKNKPSVKSQGDCLKSATYFSYFVSSSCFDDKFFDGKKRKYELI